MTNSMRYAVGSNMPGYMPDADPYEVETLEDAWGACIADIDYYIDCLEITDQVHANIMLDKMKAATPQTCTAHFGNYVFWITEL